MQSRNWGQAATGTWSTWMGSGVRGGGFGDSHLMCPDSGTASPHLLSSQDIEVAATAVHQQIWANG